MLISLFLMLSSQVSHAARLPLLSEPPRHAACYLLLAAQNVEQTAPTLAKLDALAMSLPPRAYAFGATFSGREEIENYFRAFRIAEALLETSDASTSRGSRAYRYVSVGVINLITLYAAHQFYYGLPHVAEVGTALSLAANAVELAVLGPINTNRAWAFRDWEDRRARKKINDLIASADPKLRGKIFLFSSTYQLDAGLTEILSSYRPRRQNLLRATYSRAARKESMSELLKFVLKRMYEGQGLATQPLLVDRILHFDADAGQPQLMILVQTPSI